MEVIRQKLEEDKKMYDQTNIDAGEVLSILEFMMSTTYFHFDG